MKMHQTTLNDIALKAGVSAATVSYALNGHAGVSSQTRQRIQRLAEEMHYVPHLSAQILAKRTTPIICGLVDSFTGIFNNELLDAVQDEFQATGYSLLAVNRIVPELIGSDLFRGLIVFDFNVSPEARKQIDMIGTPTIYLTHPHSSQTSSVAMDNAAAITLAYNEINQSVHRRLCILTGRSSSLNNRERLATAQRLYQRDHPGADAAAITYDGQFEFSVAEQLSSTLLKEYDAFLCFNDDMALGIYKGAFDQHLIVGQDISITGFDNSLLGRTAVPGLTTIGFDIRQWARQIVQQFQTLADAPTIPPATALIAPQLIVRGSIRYGAGGGARG
ncbi:LacI family transcriptional regulator [Schleiferilactobacillus harbinensis]|uniref:LacI family DNA-binding transcriptional regulator n=2 Tax=Schleiferilactobacillus harbinensis TaxID=304207 RepID=A0A510TSG9_9LACO|nr:LacI family transcriptional regulator [Schleiferilactobacillus harbinensis]QFR21972.1 LacI family DNA-binding transcriptional regulator [Schleiferilactobacillus harbinensis]GEK05229.1 LacI family transcriptional regulator [Schleiferilactobacillus harbinensis]HAY53483.1 hypothetical protein [Lactobacillus sp.]